MNNVVWSRWGWGVFLACFVLIFGTGCGDTFPPCQDALGCVNIRANEPIQISAILALSGDAANLGEESLQSIELALADRGATLLDHEISLQVYDSGCNPQKGQVVAQNARDNELSLGIIGPNCSDVVSAIHAPIHNSNLVMVSPSATAPELTNVASNTAVSRQGSFFRTAPKNNEQAQVAAEFAYQQVGLRTAVTIHDGTAYSRDLQQQFSQSFQRLGGNVIFQSAIPSSESEIKDLLAELLTEAPDLFYLPIFAPEANLIANKLLELDALDTVVLIGSDSLLYSAFPINAGTAVSGMYVSGTAVNTTQHTQLLQQWSDTFGTTPSGNYHAHTYDATNVLLDAIETTAINNNGALQIGRQALRDAIATTTAFSGVSGTITCTTTGECAADSAIGIYLITNSEVSGENWPPEVVWHR